MKCQVCGSEEQREWKNCCREKILICVKCCRNCEHYNRGNSLGGLTCGWNDQGLTEEKRREIGRITKQLQRNQGLLRTQKRMGWDTFETEERILYLRERIRMIEEV